MMLAPRQAANGDFGLPQRSSEGQEENAEDRGERQVCEQPFHNVKPHLSLSVRREFRENVSVESCQYNKQFFSIIPAPTIIVGG